MCFWVTFTLLPGKGSNLMSRNYLKAKCNLNFERFSIFNLQHWWSHNFHFTRSYHYNCYRLNVEKEKARYFWLFFIFQSWLLKLDWELVKERNWISKDGKKKQNAELTPQKCIYDNNNCNIIWSLKKQKRSSKIINIKRYKKSWA